MHNAIEEAAVPIKTLGLDVALKTGWAYFRPGIDETPVCGKIKLAEKGGPKACMRMLEFTARMLRSLGRDNLYVVIEGSKGFTRGVFTVDVQNKLRGCVEAACGLTVPIVEIAPQTLKKFAAGHGHAEKDDMVKAARRRWDYGGRDDDEADALAACMYGQHLGEAGIRQKIAKG